MSPENILSECMLRFKNDNPPVYEKFIETLEAYVQDAAMTVVVAPVDTMQVSQGQARMALKFFRLFTELVREPKAPSPQTR